MVLMLYDANLKQGFIIRNEKNVNVNFWSETNKSNEYSYFKRCLENKLAVEIKNKNISCIFILQ